ATQTPVVEASILREMPSARGAGEARAYRLIVSCNLETKHGTVQAAWSPLPQKGILAASVDGTAPVSYPVEGSEKMGNGSGVVTQGLAAVVLTGAKQDRVPAETLTITDLFPGETVVFPFANLPQDARQEFRACFTDRGAWYPSTPKLF